MRSCVGVWVVLLLGVVGCTASVNDAGVGEPFMPDDGAGESNEMDVIDEYVDEGGRRIVETTESRYVHDGDQVFVHRWGVVHGYGQAASTPAPLVIHLRGVGSVVRRADWGPRNSKQLTSPILEKAKAKIPKFDSTPFGNNPWKVIGTISDQLKADFEGYDVTVTANAPEEGSYTTVILGGRAADIGLERNVLGIAIVDVGNHNANDLSFVFTETMGDYGYDASHIAHVVSHEVAHSLGLKHIDREQDIMHPSACHCRQAFGSGPLTSGTGAQDDHAVLKQVVPSR